MARTEGQWKKGIGLISPSEDVPVLLRNSYLNFGGSVIGESGYGFRDNGGVMEFKNSGGAWSVFGGGSGSGDVVGPASATDNAIARFDGTTGKVIQNSAITIDDNGGIYTQKTVHGTLAGVVYRDGFRFLHDFSYGDNGTVTIAGDNLFLGNNAGNFSMGETSTNDYEASRNIGIGADALTALTTGFGNTVLGQTAGLITSGSSNSFFGYRAGYFCTTGSGNVAIGGKTNAQSSLLYNETGNSNTAVGGGSLLGTSGASFSASTAIGYEAGSSNLASYNTFIGYQAGFDVTTGAYNLILGRGQSGSGISTGSYNIMIGDNVSFGTTPTASNQLNIGNLIFATGLGTGANRSYGNVGIGTANPDSKIHAKDGTVAEFKFNSGAADLTPTIAVGNTNASGKFAALVAGTTGSLFFYDSTGYFDISSASKTVYTNNSLGSGTSRLRINSSGNIGIGNTNPGGKLEITSTAENHLRIGYSAGSYTNIFRPNDTGGLVLAPQGTEVFRVTAAGNVGIGITAPNISKLHIGGVGVHDGVLRLDTSSAGPNGTDAFIVAMNSWAAGGNKLGLGIGAPGSVNVKMTIDGATGYVGIGTTTPGTNLDIRSTGSVYQQLHLGDEDGVMSMGGNNLGQFIIVAGRTSASTNATTFSSEVRAAAGDISIGSQTGLTPGAAWAAPATRVTIKGATGYVGIGTTSPSTLLHVNGTATVSQLIYANATGTLTAHGSMGASEVIDWNAAYHEGTLDSNCTITHSNEAVGKRVTLRFTASGGNYTPTFSDVDEWAGGSAPGAVTNGDTILVTMVRFTTVVSASFETV